MTEAATQPKRRGRPPTGNARQHRREIRLSDAEAEAFDAVGPDRLRVLLAAELRRMKRAG